MPLTIMVPGLESYDDEKQQFVYSDSSFLTLEHSLVSLSKWESLWEKPFLTKDEKTDREIVSYIGYMILGDYDPEVLGRLTDENYKDIYTYIESKMTATTFSNLPPSPGSRELVTSEIIYYWMSSLNVPFECETWHLSRLFTLIKVMNQKNAPKKKMSKAEAMAQQRALNAQRRAEMGSKG